MPYDEIEWQDITKYFLCKNLRGGNVIMSLAKILVEYICIKCSLDSVSCTMLIINSLIHLTAKCLEGNSISEDHELDYN